jgi:hypothetical protein
VALLAKKAVMSVTFDPYDGRTQLPVVAASTVVLLLLALTVLVWGNGFQSLNGIAWPYLALAGAQLLISTLFFALNRYKLNVDVPLLILSGAGIVASFNRPEPEELEAAPTPVG